MYDKFSFLHPFFDGTKNVTIRAEDAQNWIFRHTWNRSRVVRHLSHRTHNDIGNYPCSTVTGSRIGKPCSFPFVFPDCSIPSHRVSYCSNTNKSKIYKKCTTADSIKPWCPTRTYLNSTWIIAEWGYCSESCHHQKMGKIKISKSKSNLETQLHDDIWEERIYYFDGELDSGHCHTYNPGQKSKPGHLGQFFASFGNDITKN